jgi:hypothetical protein
MKHLVRTSALLTLLVALLTLGLSAPGSAATKTGAVKGVVSLDGKPLKGLQIELYWTGDDGFEGKRIAVDTTDSKGAYSFTFSETNPVDPSDEFGHTIIIRDPSYRIVATSRTFTDRPGKTVTRNATVKAAGSITGSIKRGDGKPTNRLQVSAFGPSDYLNPYAESILTYEDNLVAAADGSFALRGLPAGDYYLQFVDQNKTYFSQCYDNIPAAGINCDGTDDSTTKSTKITVGTGQTVTLKPQVLSTRGKTISGTVTNTSGNPIRYARVGAVEDEGDGAGDATANSTGSFVIGPLPDGHYRLEAGQLNYVTQWFDGKATQADATVVDVTAGAVSGVHIKLKSRASMKVHLTPGAGSVTGTFDVTRLATGGKGSGTVKISWGAISKTVALVKGHGTAKLSGLPRGTRTITVTYSGSPSTASNTKILHAVVR